jgi:hypothetical protein
MKIRKRKQRWPLPVMALLLMTCLCLPAMAQNITVTGTVVSDSSEALGNVTVSLKSDPRVSTVTDAMGRFSINVPANGTLTFSFVGYDKYEQDIRGESKLRIILKHSASAMDDVIVVGFGGRQKKSSVVSAITTINPKELKGPTSNLTTMRSTVWKALPTTWRGCSPMILPPFPF